MLSPIHIYEERPIITIDSDYSQNARGLIEELVIILLGFLVCFLLIIVSSFLILEKNECKSSIPAFGWAFCWTPYDVNCPSLFHSQPQPVGLM